MNRYDLDLTGLQVYTFSRSAEWFEYIFHNRRAKDTIDADVVYQKQFAAEMETMG